MDGVNARKDTFDVRHPTLDSKHDVVCVVVLRTRDEIEDNATDKDKHNIGNEHLDGKTGATEARPVDLTRQLAYPFHEYRTSQRSYR